MNNNVIKARCTVVNHWFSSELRFDDLQTSVRRYAWLTQLFIRCCVKVDVLQTETGTHYVNSRDFSRCKERCQVIYRVSQDGLADAAFINEVACRAFENDISAALPTLCRANRSQFNLIRREYSKFTTANDPLFDSLATYDVLEDEITALLNTLNPQEYAESRQKLEALLKEVREPLARNSEKERDETFQDYLLRIHRVFSANSFHRKMNEIRQEIQQHEEQLQREYADLPNRIEAAIKAEQLDEALRLEERERYLAGLCRDEAPKRNIAQLKPIASDPVRIDALQKRIAELAQTVQDRFQPSTRVYKYLQEQFKKIDALPDISNFDELGESFKDLDIDKYDVLSDSDTVESLAFEFAKRAILRQTAARVEQIFQSLDLLAVVAADEQKAFHALCEEDQRKTFVSQLQACRVRVVQFPDLAKVFQNQLRLFKKYNKKIKHTDLSDLERKASAAVEELRRTSETLQKEFPHTVIQRHFEKAYQDLTKQPLEVPSEDFSRWDKAFGCPVSNQTKKVRWLKMMMRMQKRLALVKEVAEIEHKIWSSIQVGDADTVLELLRLPYQKLRTQKGWLADARKALGCLLMEVEPFIKTRYDLKKQECLWVVEKMPAEKAALLPLIDELMTISAGEFVFNDLRSLLAKIRASTDGSNFAQDLEDLEHLPIHAMRFFVRGRLLHHCGSLYISLKPRDT